MEYLVAVLLGDGIPVVKDFEEDLLLVVTELDADLGVGILEGVAQQVAEDLGDGFGVDHADERFVGQQHLEIFGAQTAVGFVAVGYLLYDAGDIVGFKMEDKALLLDLTEVEELIGQGVESFHIPLHDVEFSCVSDCGDGLHDALNGALMRLSGCVSRG